MSEQKVMRREFQGIVLSSKMQKTITVGITRTIRHPKYHKFIKKRAKYHAHDEHNQCKEGDVVSIVQARPYSKTKKWRLKQIIERSDLI